VRLVLLESARNIHATPDDTFTPDFCPDDFMRDFQVIIGTVIGKRQVSVIMNDDKGRLAVLCLYDLISMLMYSQLWPNERAFDGIPNRYQNQ